MLDGNLRCARFADISTMSTHVRSWRASLVEGDWFLERLIDLVRAWRE
jgi:hypothetical protein